MAKGESPSGSASSEANPDRWAGDVENVQLVYPPLPTSGWRPLPDMFMADAYAYINQCVRRYPANWRQNPAWAMWLDFCVEWHKTGDFFKAMRAI